MKQTTTVDQAITDVFDAIQTEPPLQAVAHLRELIAMAEEAQRAMVARARDPERSGIRDTWTRRPLPATWEQLGAALGVSRSAAWQRFTP